MQLLKEKTIDCVIIGGGVAGLTASIYLAKAGKSVLVLEKSKTLGGRGKTTKKMDSYLNLGPHALYSKGVSMEILRELGIEIEGGIVPTKGSMIYNKKVFDIPATPTKLLTSPLLNWQAKKELISFFMKYQKINTNDIQHIPLREWVQHNIKDKVARKLILMLSRLSTYCNEPDLMSAGAALNQLQLGNAIYLDYGWQTMIEALEKIAVKVGVIFQTSENVENVKGTFPQFTVHTNKEMFQARTVLSTSTPNGTANLLSEYENTPNLKEYIPIQVACMDLILSSLPNPKINFAMGLDEPLYYSNHSKIARLSQQDYQIIHVMKYANSNEETLKTLENFMEVIQPGWKEYVVYKRYLPRMTVSNSIVLANKNKIQSPLIEQIPGLYIAGDWVGEGMLVNASFQSARKAAQLIAKKLL